MRHQSLREKLYEILNKMNDGVTILDNEVSDYDRGYYEGVSAALKLLEEINR